MNTEKYYNPNFIMQYTQKSRCVRCRQPVCRCALTLYLAYHGLSASDMLSLNRVRLQTTRTPLFRYNGYNDRPYPPEYTSPYGPIEKPSPNENFQTLSPNGYTRKLIKNEKLQKPYINETILLNYRRSETIVSKFAYRARRRTIEISATPSSLSPTSPTTDQCHDRELNLGPVTTYRYSRSLSVCVRPLSSFSVSSSSSYCHSSELLTNAQLVVFLTAVYLFHRVVDWLFELVSKVLVNRKKP